MDDRTFLEQGRSRTWLDPVGAKELSSACMRMLKSKFDCIAKRKGRKLYFCTLTYDPEPWGVDDWNDANVFELADAAESCWDAMTEDRHVSRFMRRLEEETGEDFRGRWWSKREFTKAGFVHHHLLVEGPDFLDYGKVCRCWGHGRVDCQVARSHQGLAWYVGKYCTKYGDDPPPWILARPVGTVRITTSSDGWWSELKGDLSEAPRSVRDRHGEPRCDAGLPRCDAARHRAEDEAYGCYESIGDRIRRQAETVVVRRSGVRVNVQGATLDEWRASRDEKWYRRHLVKERSCMDAVTGLPVSQAVRELREVAAAKRRTGVLSPSLNRHEGGEADRSGMSEANGRERSDRGLERSEAERLQAVVGSTSLILSSPQECGVRERQGVLFGQGEGYP